MRQALWVLLMLFVPRMAAAKCAYYAETLLTPEVPAGTPSIFFEIYAIDDPGLIRDDQIALVTLKRERIPLSVRATHKGMSQTQVVLLPKKPLAIGEYRLYRGTRPDGASRESHVLKVVAAGAAVALTAPTVVATRSQLTELGCGPDEHVVLELSPTSARFALVTLSGKDGSHQQGLVRVANDEGKTSVALGHGMCSGEFTLSVGMEYTAQLQWMGSDGVLGPSTSTVLTYRP